MENFEKLNIFTREKIEWSVSEEEFLKEQLKDEDLLKIYENICVDGEIGEE